MIVAMKLSDYLSDPGRSATMLADEVGCEPSTITRVLRGERRPSIDLAVRIELATSGLVTVHDLATPADEGAR